ncbi:MAG: hypothetical protein WC208_14035 [Gallionella sp.]
MARSNPELFSKKETPETSEGKRKALSYNAILGIKKGQILKYFGEKWQAKYGLPFLMPPNSFVSVEKPIKDALAKNYTVEQMCKGIDLYLANEFQGYTEQSHPIRFFTKDIPKWVISASKETTRQATTQTDEARLLNEKYGILKRGELWETEDGRKFSKSEDAVRHAEKKGNVS